MEVDWSECPETEVIAGKVSGVPLLIGTRIPAEAITVNFESALRRGLTPDKAILEVSEDYPGAGVQRIKRLLDYYHSRQLQSQL